MKILGINITFGDPEKRKQRRLKKWAQNAIQELIWLYELDQNKIKDEAYYPWWKDCIPWYANWIRRHIDDPELRNKVTNQLGAYLKQREIDIELQNDELTRLTVEIRKRSK